MINLKIGKIYILSTFNNEHVKYIGFHNEIENLYLFEWKNPLSQRIVIRRIFNENDTYNEIDSGDDTDNEFLDDPY
jgi:hypothetical protein